jgi:uncharacterized protein YwgA
MNKLERTSMLVSLTERLRENGSWAGETHLQKATYILARVLRVPVDFEFILYKHGPFSFDLRNEMGALRADGFLEWELKSNKYGPSLKPGPMSEVLKRQFPDAPMQYKAEIEFVASRLGNKNVAALERLATAIYVTLDERWPADQRALRINELKRHVNVSEAEAAVAEADVIIHDATSQFRQTQTA